MKVLANQAISQICSDICHKFNMDLGTKSLG